MRKNIYLLFFLFISACLFAQAPAWSWVKDAYSNNDELATDVVVDKVTGDVYSAGVFEGGLNSFFGTLLQNTYGSKDGFIAKHTNSGVFVWAFKVGGTGNDEVTSVACDAAGNVYVSGTFEGIADFDPSAATASLSANGLKDVFLAKYSSSGNFIWAVKGGGPQNDNAHSVYADANGVYLCGDYRGSAVFNSTSAATKSTSAAQAEENVFGAKYSPAGVCEWVISAGSSQKDVARMLVADAQKVYLIGDYKNALTVYNANGTNASTVQNTAAGKADVFILAYDLNGILQWTSNVVSSNEDYGEAITQDAANLYITGSMNANISMPFPNAVLTRICNGGSDYFIACISKSGIFQWVSAQSGCGGGDEFAKDITFNNGSLVVCGRFKSTLSFSSFGGTNISSSGNVDVFMSAFNTNGNYQWAAKAGSGGNDAPYGIDSYDDDVFLCGSYENSAVFGNFTLNNSSGQNYFTGKTGCVMLANNIAYGSQTICANSQPSFLTGSVPTGTSAPFSYQWEHSADAVSWQIAPGNSTGQNYFPPALNSNTYYRRRIITSQSCTTTVESNTVVIVTKPGPSPAVAGSDQTICTNSIQLSALTPTQGSGGWTIIQGSGNISGTSNPTTTITNLPLGKTKLKWSVSFGVCPASVDTLEVERKLPPDAANAGSDLNIESLPVKLSANTPTAGNGYWTVTNGYAEIANPNDPNSTISNMAEGTNILVWNIAVNGCYVNSDELSVFYRKLNTPNAFTPNDDGINDVFVVPNITGISGVKFYVYNRWGNIVYQSEDYKNNWRGNNRDNERLADDTYYYILEIPEKEAQKGFILLKNAK